MSKSISFSNQQKQVVNTLSGLKAYTLKTFPHYLHPNNTLSINGGGDDDDGTEDGGRLSPSLGIQTTYPTKLDFPVDDPSVVEENIVLKLVEQKNQYTKNAARLTGNVQRPNKGEKLKKNRNNIYSMHLNNLMELTVCDPDPFFFGTYNWYYTGGTLETTSVFDLDLLFYVNGEKLNIFNSARLESSRDGLKLEHLDSSNQTVCDTIFEITKSNDYAFVAARQRNRITVFSLLDEFTKQDFHCEREIPFISATFVENFFYSIDANRVIQRYDLHENRECSEMYLKRPKNNSFWCQLKAYKNQLVFADEQKVKVYDSRILNKKRCMMIEINFDGLTEKCEEITCIRPSESDNNLYVTTTHSLFVFDIRYAKESNEVTRYTHQMRTPPFIIDGIGDGCADSTSRERIVALSGTFTDDIVVVRHTRNPNKKLPDQNIPLHVRSLSDLNKKIREEGMSAGAEKILMVNRSMNVGMSLARIKDELFLLSEKSSGEIYYQKVKSKCSQLEGEWDDKPVCSSNSVESSSHPINVTTVTNFDSMKRILNYNLPDEVKDIDLENPRYEKWQQTLEEMEKYKDFLSADLLKVWQESFDISAKITNQQMDKSERVSGWVNESSFQGSQTNFFDGD